MNKYLFLLMTIPLCTTLKGATETQVTAIQKEKADNSSLSLNVCRQMAHDNYPTIKQYHLIEQSRDFTLNNAVKGWLPRVSVTAGAYAFTDIIKTNAITDRMGIDMKNWTANASVTIQQSVYDGGQIAAQKEVANANSETQKQQLNVSMYSINERIDNIYFGILLLDEQLTQNALLQQDLSTSEKTIRTMMAGGVANQSDLDAILVEQLKAKQQEETLQESRKAYIRMLGVFIGKELTENERLEKPIVSPCNGRQGVARPELQYYASVNKSLDAQRKLLDSQLRPTISLFGVGMIHSNVSSLVNDALLVGGVSMSWNIGALYIRKNDINKLETQRAMNASQQETFIFNNRLQNEETDGAIASLQKLIAQDDEIVQLRESIRSKADKKVQLGTESVNELIRDINAVNLARAQKAQHEVQLLKEIYRQKNINNNY